MKSTKSKGKKHLIQQSVNKTIDGLQRHLTDQENSKEYIHRIRVDIKHFRAWLRLQCFTNNGKDWKNMDAQLAEQAKYLGTTRDSEALTDTLISLINSSNTQKERAAILYAQEQLQSVLISSAIDWREFKDTLLESLTIFKQKFVSFDSMHNLKERLKYTYKKTRQAAKIAFSKEGADEDVHQFRKWVKHLNYQLSYVSKAYPRCIKIKHDIDKLGNLLGKAHDLILIKEKLKQVPENEFREIIFDLIDKNISLTLKKSHHIYKTIFNSSAKKFIRQI